MTGGGRVTHATPMTRIQTPSSSSPSTSRRRATRPPSDIQLAFSIGSTNAVHDRIVALEKRSSAAR
jgi:hypothetical protein